LPSLAGLFFCLKQTMNKEIKNIKKLIVNQSLELDCGKIIKNFPIAYETYGTLNKSKSNAILVFHALSGDQFVTNINPITKKEGWWTTAVGPGKAIDTDKYFVICANVLGGCMGSFGPKEINPDTNELFGITFPVITIRDMVRAQIYLLEYLGIDKLLSITGGSMGGMQVLQFASLYPNKTYSAIPIACSASHSAQNIALDELGRQAIMADPNWNNGNYFKTNLSPDKGLAIARMAAHITYLSKKSLQEKFGRKLQVKGNLKFSFDADFQIESYLRHQGSVFVDRFDANSYLYITRAMDYFDLPNQKKGGLKNIYKNTPVKFCVISFTSDWVYPTKYSKEIVDSLNTVGADVSFVEIQTDKGHDAFLLDEKEFNETVRGFLNSTADIMKVN